jgi:hypothetical protein
MISPKKQKQTLIATVFRFGNKCVYVRASDNECRKLQRALVFSQMSQSDEIPTTEFSSVYEDKDMDTGYFDVSLYQPSTIDISVSVPITNNDILIQAPMSLCKQKTYIFTLCVFWRKIGNTSSCLLYASDAVIQC